MGLCAPAVVAAHAALEQSTPDDSLVIVPGQFVEMAGVFQFMGFPPLQQLAIVADVGFFQAGGKHHIQQDAGNQVGKVGRRQRHKT